MVQKPNTGTKPKTGTKPNNHSLYKSILQANCTINNVSLLLVQHILMHTTWFTAARLQVQQHQSTTVFVNLRERFLSSIPVQGNLAALLLGAVSC